VNTGESTEKLCGHADGFRITGNTTIFRCECKACGKDFPLHRMTDDFDMQIRVLDAQVRYLLERLDA
jgi:hypothetical protein